MADEPQPSEYGLDEPTVQYFSSYVHAWELLSPLLGWASFIGLNVFPPFGFSGFDYVSKHQWTWPLLLLYFVPGVLLGVAINKLRELYLEWAKKRHRLYSNWNTYLAARSHWYEINADRLAAERKQRELLRKQHYEQRRRDLARWKTLPGREFEMETASLLRKLGYDVTLTPYCGDGGVDIVVRDGTKRILVQCKAHRNYISAGAVRELYGTLIHEKADEGWLVITSGFYSGARAFARDKPIKLLTIKDLLNQTYVEP